MLLRTDIFYKDTHNLALKQLCECLTLVDSSRTTSSGVQQPMFALWSPAAKKFQRLQSMLFPSVSTVDMAVWATLEESQEDALRTYTHTKLQILQCAYLEQFLRGDLTDFVGRWIYLVGNGIWRNETFDREDDAIERGCSDSGMGYPRGVFTALVLTKTKTKTFLYRILRWRMCD